MKTKKTGFKIFIILLSISLMLLLAEFFIHKHVYFGLESSFFFNAWFSFLSSGIMVFIACLVRFFLKRSGDYYKE